MASKLNKHGRSKPSANVPFLHSLTSPLGIACDFATPASRNLHRIASHLHGDGKESFPNICPDLPVEPVGDVERPVRAQSEDVMRCDGLCLAGPLQHEELGQNGHRLEIDTERPHDLHKVKVIVEEQCQNETGTHEVLQPDGVDGGIVRGTELDLHQIQDVDAGTDEEHLHQESVERVFVEEIEIS